MNDNGQLDKNFSDSIAGKIVLVLRYLIEKLGGPDTQKTVLGSITWSDIGVMAFFFLSALLLTALAALLFHKKINEITPQAEGPGLQHHYYQALSKPFHAVVWVLTVYMILTPLLLKINTGDRLYPLCVISDKLLLVAVYFVFIWLFLRFTHVLEIRLAAWAGKNSSRLDSLLVPLIVKSLGIIVPVLGVLIALPLLELPAKYADLLSKGGSILLIGAVAMILIEVVNVAEKVMLLNHDITAADNLRARGIYTQVHVISKTLYFLIILFSIASSLLLFDKVKSLGTSLFASAGVAGIIVGVAAQKTLANLFAGFQIAMTQPIRLDDVVIVETEWGRIEEITLTYVVVHIWDDRRMVLPLTYFIEKPFENWTRTTAQITGSVMLWTDYTLPVEEMRKFLKEVIEPHPLWDKRFWNIQVSDATEHTMQIRVLATSADSSKSWDLRCAIREQLIAYIQKNHPQCLPKLRTDLSAPFPASRDKSGVESVPDPKT